MPTNPTTMTFFVGQRRQRRRGARLPNELLRELVQCMPMGWFVGRTMAKQHHTIGQLGGTSLDTYLHCARDKFAEVARKKKMNGEQQQQSQQQNTTGQLIQLLEATLAPESVKRAEEELQKLTTFPGFARTMLQIICDTVLPGHLRNAASVSLKNFVRTNWSGEGEAPLADDERHQLRNMLMENMFQMPPYLRPQMAEIVCQISKVDFPYRWPQLIQLLAQHLQQAATDFDQLAVSLGTLEQLVHRYRHEMHSNELWTEILLVVTNVAEPLTQLYSRMLQYLPDPANQSTQLALSDRVAWLQIVLELTRIYHSLIAQDLPECFENNLTPWMEGFLQLLELKLPELDDISVNTEPNEHDKLRCEICKIATLFLQHEDHMPYAKRFIASVWNLLVMTDGRIRFDTMVSAALSFLAAICQRPHYAPHFREEGVLKAICDNVVIKNLMLRTEDLELCEGAPFEFLKRDIEGSDLETRRRGATDFVRALCKQFESEVCQLLSTAIKGLLTDYQQNPDENFVKKDVVYYLVTSQLINVADFYQKHVRTELLFGVLRLRLRRQSEGYASGQIAREPHMILHSDALKYLVLFRHQLTPDQIVECLRGQNGQTESSIIRLLSSKHLLLHHYVAYAVERLLLTKAPNSQNNLLTCDNVPIPVLIDALFDCFRVPQAYETHYIVKALMRTFSLISDQIATSNAPQYVNKLSQMVAEAIQVSKNPLFLHYVFESLCVLIRKAYAKVSGGLDQHVIPIIELIISNDVVEFIPYALQLIALMLDQSEAEKRRGVAVSQDAYIRFFPTLLRPDYWSHSTNVPALILVFESFLRCFPQLCFSAQHSDQVLGIFQRLIDSEAYDQHGFRLANALLPQLDSDVYERPFSTNTVLLTMLNRMQQNKTSEYRRQFALFIFRYAAVKGALTLANALEAIMAGMYGMVMGRIVIADMHSMPQTTTYEEKRIVTIGAAKLITETASHLGQRYAQLVELVVYFLEAFEHHKDTTTSGTAADAQQEEDPSAEGQNNELEYSDPYHPDPEPFASDIGDNIKKHFAEAVLVTAHGINPANLKSLNAWVQSYLRDYLNSAA